MKSQRPFLFLPSLLLSALSILVAAPPASAAPTKPGKAKPASKPAAKSTKPAAKKPQQKKPQQKKPQQKPAPTPPRPTVVPTPVPTPVVETGPRTFALLVGVGDYASPAVSDLDFPAVDATALRDALADPALGGVPRERVMLLANEEATRAGILGAVDSFFKPKVKEGDRMIVFLAGHGITKGIGLAARSWLLPHDVKGFTTPDLNTSAVDLKELSLKLGELPASQFAVFVDACREDPTPGRGIKSNALSDVMARSVQVTSPDRHVDAATIFACSVGQRAYEDSSLKHGVFTHAILQGLRDPSLPRVDGFVDAAVLARYVSDKVADWSRRIAQEQSIDIQQTPELVAGELREGVRILRLRDKDATGAPAGPALPARLGVLTVPDRARVFIDGRPVGLAPLIRNFPADSLAAGGEVKMRVEAPGIAPYERTIKLLPGYSQQVEVDLLKVRPTGAAGTAGTTGAGTTGTTGTTEPVITSTSGVSNSAEDPLLGRAARAEEIGQYEVAESAYALILESDPKNAGAYERLSQLRARRGDWAGAINALADMNRKMPGARALTLLSRAYSSHSMRLAASEATLPTKLARGRVSVQPWLVPKTSWENAIYALNAADAALKADPKSTDALIARGLAFVAGDVTGNDQKQAMESLSRAILTDEENAEAHYAFGVALRSFGRQNTDAAARKEQMVRARQSLAKAIELRPSFYEARREMALAAALMGDRELALRECEVAISYRGGASDPDEMAGLGLAMAAWHQAEAKEETNPEKKQEHEEASAGYTEEAKEDAADKSLKTAGGSIKQNFGETVAFNIIRQLPGGFASVMSFVTDPAAAAKAAVQNKVDEKKNELKDRLLGGIGGFGR